MKETLESLRKKSRHSIEYLAVTLDISPTTIRNWEKGRIDADKMPVRSFVKFCRIYNISMQKMYEAIQNSI